MKRVLQSLLVLAVLAAALWLLTRGEAAAMPASDQPTAAAAPATGVERDAATDPLQVARSAVEGPTAEPASPAATADGLCIVRGRVLDSDRRPVPDAEVKLSAYQVWAEGHDVPRIDDVVDWRGFVTRTDVGGAFRFAVMPPTNQRQRLRIAPNPFLDSLTAYFGTDSRERRAALAEGETDLGELVLVAAGAVSGRVVDTQGAPVAGAEVDLGPSPSTTYGRDACTRADGTFFVPHAPIGTYGVRIKATGYVSAFVTPVVVEARRETGGLAVALAVAESIQGTVRDEHGAPLAGAKLQGWPTSEGSGAGAKSDSDGRFTVFLPQAGPYTLSATLEGYEQWGNEHDSKRLFAPGTRDLDIVMKALARIAVTVVDEMTAEPLLRFGVEVLADNGSRAGGLVHTERRRPRDQDHSGGVALVSARSGVDLLVVAAEGYVLTTVDADAGDTSPPAQTVRLRRAPVVRGRAWRNGAPLANAAVELVSGSMDAAPGPIGRLPDPATLAGQRSEPNWFRPDRNGARTARTDAEGRFALAPERPGDLRLSIEAGPGWSLVRAPLRTVAATDLELGDLHAEAAGAIDGTVLLPAGVVAAGLKVYRGDWAEEVTVPVDAAGRFRFDDLSPGHHLLTLGERPGVLASSAGVLCEVRSGGTTPITLDARDRGMCEVALRIVADGAELAGMQVSLVGADESMHETLGKIGADGFVRGIARGSRTAVVHLTDLGVALTDQPIELTIGDRVERTVRLSLGRLALQWPPGRTPAEGTLVRFELAPVAAGGLTQSGSMKVAARAETGERFRADVSGAHLDQVAAGRSRLQVTVTDPSVPLTHLIEKGGTISWPPVVFEASAEVVVTAGALTTVQL
jgi:protocatechuate 3,4-dioxygenase beta subunit